MFPILENDTICAANESHIIPSKFRFYISLAFMKSWSDTSSPFDPSRLIKGKYQFAACFSQLDDWGK